MGRRLGAVVTGCLAFATLANAQKTAPDLSENPIVAAGSNGLVISDSGTQNEDVDVRLLVPRSGNPTYSVSSARMLRFGAGCESAGTDATTGRFLARCARTGQRVTVALAGGNDHFRVIGTMPDAVAVNGGAGADTIVTAAGIDDVQG